MLLHAATSIQVKAQVAAQHQVEDHEHIFVVLECVLGHPASISEPCTIALPPPTPLTRRLQIKGDSISSSRRLSWMMLDTALILMHFALLMYLSA